MTSRLANQSSPPVLKMPTTGGQSLHSSLALQEPGYGASRSMLERRAIQSAAKQWLLAKQESTEYLQTKLEAEIEYMIAKSSPQTLEVLKEIFRQDFGET